MQRRKFTQLVHVIVCSWSYIRKAPWEEFSLEQSVRRLKAGRVVDEITSTGRAFQTRAAMTGKALHTGPTFGLSWMLHHSTRTALCAKLIAGNNWSDVINIIRNYKVKQVRLNSRSVIAYRNITQVSHCTTEHCYVQKNLKTFLFRESYSTFWLNSCVTFALLHCQFFYFWCIVFFVIGLVGLCSKPCSRLSLSLLSLPRCLCHQAAQFGTGVSLEVKRHTRQVSK